MVPYPINMEIARDKRPPSPETSDQGGLPEVSGELSGDAAQAGVKAHRGSTAQAQLDLNETERRLLGDLFAIVSEHAADSAVEIDRDRVRLLNAVAAIGFLAFRPLGRTRPSTPLACRMTATAN